MRLLTTVAFGMFMLCSSQSSQAWWMWTPGDAVDDSSQSMFGHGYHPDQPIPFSHKLHAGERKIPCEYCHSGARRSPVAGIPPTNTCMGCHRFVATDKEPIQFITDKYKKNEPIEWTKVHDLPDHVRFTHKPHVLAGVECQTCHGPVEESETAEQWAPLQMGWCVGCHSEIKEPATTEKASIQRAPITCNTCHY